MHFSQSLIILTGLVASASAIDVRRYVTQRACNGNYIVCPNLSPDTCCGDNNTYFGAVGFFAIPTNWNIECRGHNGGQCNGLAQLERNFGRDTVCLTNGPFSGGGYGFVSKKRAVSGQTSQEVCARASSGVFEDGTEFDLDAMTEEQREEFMKVLSAGGSAADLPEYLAAHRR